MKFLVFLSIFVVFAAVMVTCSAQGMQGPLVGVHSRIASPSQAMCTTDAGCKHGCFCVAETCTC